LLSTAVGRETALFRTYISDVRDVSRLGRRLPAPIAMASETIQPSACRRASLLLAAILLQRSPQRTLFLVAASTLLLLFIGIHNAWDTVTYIAIHVLQREKKKK